jgi:pimeloyl-ACP methyl ester carboxylesterase
MAKVTIGHRLFGEGPEGVLVLHGWFGDHSVFGPVFPALDTKTFSYAFMDYRGYGLSRPITGEYSIAEIAQDALDLADRLGWKRFHVIGHSMGGSAAQRVCVDATARVKSCVCLTPVPASGNPMQGEQLALFTGATVQDANRRAIIGYSTGNRLPAAWLDYLIAESHRTTTAAAFAAYFRAWSGTNFVAESKGLETPMLVAVGEHDLALTADVMRATFLDWYPNAVLEVLPNAGHYPMQETPVYLAGLIDEFMRQHSRR